MSPSSSDDDTRQSLIVIRHGDRWDYAHREWLDTAERRGDPPLSRLGHQQARETGAFLDRLIKREGITDITWLSSPFLRTLQTSSDALNAFAEDNDIAINPEYSIFEMDGHDGNLHKDLPEMSERKLYFPRINTEHESLFIPTIPEPRADFLGRCDRSVSALNKRYKYKAKSAIIMITHAAGCIGIAKYASQSGLDDVVAAGPCSVYRLSRHSQTDHWDLPKYNKPEGLNGYMGHISESGTTTVPWNNFGDKKYDKGYTGPPRDENEEEVEL